MIDLATRRVQVLGITPHPDEAFMCQVVRTLTMAVRDPVSGFNLRPGCEVERAVRERLGGGRDPRGETPHQGAERERLAERLVRFLKEKCLDQRFPSAKATFDER